MLRFIAPGMAGSVLDHHITWSNQLLLAVVEFEPKFSFQQYAVVNRRRPVHARTFSLEAFEKTR
ncbi:hypothetical protein D3C80_2046210 [compost metagenome]